MRLILLFVFLTNYLFALINTPIHTQITSVHDEEVTASYVEGAQVGMYGAIVHWFDKTHSIALSWVEVKKIDGETITLSTAPILALEQSALPSGKWEPKAGDEVILGYNYQRGLLIAPNNSVYKKVTYFHKEREWIHPDVFAATLSRNGHPTPLREDFEETCRSYNIGVVAFMFDKSLITLDCQSFKVMENKSTSIKAEDPQLPFYTRVTNIEANWFGEGSDELEEYSPYYIELIAENNPENEWIHIYKMKREQATMEEDESWFGSIFKSMKLKHVNDNEYDEND